MTLATIVRDRARTVLVAGGLLSASATRADPTPAGMYRIRYIGPDNPPALYINGARTPIEQATLTFQIGDRITIRAEQVAETSGRTRTVSAKIHYVTSYDDGGIFSDGTPHYTDEHPRVEEKVNVNGYIDYGPTLSIVLRGKPPAPWPLWGIGAKNPTLTLAQLEGKGYAFTASRSGTLVLLTPTSFAVKPGTFWLAAPPGQPDTDWCKSYWSHWCDGRNWRDPDIACQISEITCVVGSGKVDVTVLIKVERPD